MQMRPFEPIRRPTKKAAPDPESFEGDHKEQVPRSIEWSRDDGSI